MKFTKNNYAGKDLDGTVYYINRNERKLARVYIVDKDILGEFTKGQVKKAYNLIRNEETGIIFENYIHDRDVKINYKGEVSIGCCNFTKKEFFKICNKVLSMK